jgi:hypothetical protein
MFTNLRKYMEANKPQTQRMAGAVTQQFGQQAEKTAQQAQQRAQQFGSQIQQRQNVMEAERQFAGDVGSRILQQQQGAQPAQPFTPSFDIAGKLQEKRKELEGKRIFGEAAEKQIEQERQKLQSDLSAERETFEQQQRTAQQEAAPLYSEEEYERVRQAITGGATPEDIQELNLAGQVAGAEQLQRQAEAAQTAEGRAGLLQETFGAGTRDYTRGQAGLDALLLQSSPEARQQLLEGTQAQAQQTQEAVEQARKDALQQLTGYREERAGFGQSVADIMSGRGEELSSQIDERVAQAQAERQQLADQLGTTTTELEQYLGEVGAGIDPTKTSAAFDLKYIRDGYQEGLLRSGLAGAQDISDLAFQALGTDRKKALEAEAWLNTERQRSDAMLYGHLNPQAQAKAKAFQEQLQSERDEAGRQEMLENIYGASGAQAATGDVRSAEDLSRYMAGEDITRASVAKAQDVARYSALQDLLKGRGLGQREFQTGQEGLGTAGRGQAELAALQEYIKKGMI